ncbi:MAG: GGDEF domain-containing protein [Veillonellales bacterium]
MSEADAMSIFPNAPDSAVEQFYLKEDLLHTKIAIIVAICFCLIFIRNDYVFFGIGPLFFQAVLARVIFASLSAGALFLLRKIKTYRQHEQLVYMWCSLLILLCTYINITRQVDNINFTYLNPLVVLLIAIYLPGNIWKKIILAGWLATSDLTIVVFLKTPKYALSLEVIASSYLLSLLLGFVIAAKFRNFRYEQYYALVKEHTLRLELEKVAYTDYLTGALNRRKFFQLGERQFNLFKESEGFFSIIMLDVDYFKNLNDKFGHAAGDIFLKSFTKTIVDHKHSGDILGRLGGEEFALILPGTKLESAIETAERLRNLSENNEAFFNKKVLQTTVSIGVTEVSTKDKAFHDVLKRADDALYLAKSKGRNRVQLIARDA